jgi:hypothetical protein
MKLGYLLAIVNAQKSAILSEWSQWSQCDAPCGGGQMVFSRDSQGSKWDDFCPSEMERWSDIDKKIA